MEACRMAVWNGPFRLPYDTVQCFVSTTEVVCEWEIGTTPAFDSDCETGLYAERK